MGKGFYVHLRKEEVELLTLVSRHRMMDPKAAAQDILSIGILAEVDKLRALFGDEWREKMKQKLKGKKYE